MEKTSRLILAAGIIIILLLAALAYYSLFNKKDSNQTGNNISTGINPAKGNSSSSIILIEFSDFQCPACRAALPVIDAVLTRYDIAFYYRNFPLPIHENSMIAAEAAECANEQGEFWSYHNILFQNQERLDAESLKEYAEPLGLDAAQFNACLDSHKYRSEVERDFQDGRMLGVGGTPTFFINGRKVEGASLNVFEGIINDEMAKNA